MGRLKNKQMVGPVFIFISLFLVLFGISYLYFSTRNKERMALIEKGADASIFVKGKSEKAAPFWKIFILNLALLLMGIGAGIVVGGILQENLAGNSFYAMPGTIFLLAGTGLLIGFFITKKLDRET
jgi:uncharacterized membrane protein